MAIEKITHSYETTNGTSRFAIVGDYHVVISDHETAQEANDALNELAPGLDGLAATPWSIVEVLAPGESTSGKLEQTFFTGSDLVWTEKNIYDLFGCDMPEGQE